LTVHVTYSITFGVGIMSNVNCYLTAVGGTQCADGHNVSLWQILSSIAWCVLWLALFSPVRGHYMKTYKGRWRQKLCQRINEWHTIVWYIVKQNC